MSAGVGLPAIEAAGVQEPAASYLLNGNQMTPPQNIAQFAMKAEAIKYTGYWQLTRVCRQEPNAR